MSKILWVKFGWSEYYRGGPVGGNFGWLKQHIGKEDEGRGHEAFNFMPDASGTYYCYVPPQGEGHAPSHDDRDGWTVVCLSKHPKHKGIHVVGWYEDATLIGREVSPNPVAEAQGEPHSSYCITSKRAFFVPPDLRIDPFSDPSVKQGKYSFLAGAGVKANDNKARVLALLEQRIAALRPIAISGPDDERAPDPENGPDPLAGFGTTEHRKAVECAAETAVKKHYESLGYKPNRVAHLNRGYDYEFTKDDSLLIVEVKGTSLATACLFLTRNEYIRRVDDGWRLAMVTDALGERPHVSVYDLHEFHRTFDLEPLVLIGRPIFEPKVAA
ncbi:hypothetical protein C3941_02015 [Kaistia algarum]|uniref:protein NO VEIN domain-containing protein n=1 Tax=Kaistia algarum TaxID=2083279 RepID=UPI000CE81CC7|nr:DUF3883 domain-containing protein [Kaistia algarum]MCX5513006.1 DUF3883 domain-containing protein [Kaistia algarum]PPE81511.1 hypothetical protein C3941_02015 [Kaistia algarum]